MRNRHDQFAKLLLREALGPLGSVETQAEVMAEPQMVDVWFVPDPAPDRAEELSRLGLLGRMADAPCLFEPYRGVPSVEEVTDCVRKALQLRHAQRLRERRAAAADGPVRTRTPRMWILSSGRPERALRDFRFVDLAEAWPVGVYETVPALDTRLVVLAELPRTRETLLLRLMGSGRVWKGACEDLRGLPEDAFERGRLLPIMVRYQLEIPPDPAEQTEEEQEFIMNAQELFEEYRNKTRQEGRQEGELHAWSRMFARRIGRPLTEAERSALAARIAREGTEHLDDLLDLQGDALLAWLAG